MSKPSYGFYLLHQMLLLPIIYYIVIDKIGIKSISPAALSQMREHSLDGTILSSSSFLRTV